MSSDLLVYDRAELIAQKYRYEGRLASNYSEIESLKEELDAAGDWQREREKAFDVIDMMDKKLVELIGELRETGASVGAHVLALLRCRQLVPLKVVIDVEKAATRPICIGAAK
jgi:hypothetical protein